MLLLKNKLSSLAIGMMALSPFVVTSIQCRADGAPVTPPAPPAAASAAPTVAAGASAAPAKPVYGQSVSESEISRYIRNFRIVKDTSSNGESSIHFIGLAQKACLDHIRIEIDPPADDNMHNYAVRIEKSDLRDASGAVSRRIDDDCKPDQTRQCTRDPDSGCISIRDDAARARVAQDFVLDKDGKIQLKLVDTSKDEGDPAQISYHDFTSAQGGPLSYKSPATVAAEQADADAKSRNEEIHSDCRKAEGGDRDALEKLKGELSSDELENAAKFIDKLGKRVDQKEFMDLEAKVDKLDNAEDYVDFLDTLMKFAEDHPDLKKKVAKLLATGVAERGDEIDGDDVDSSSDDDSDSSHHHAHHKSLKSGLKARALKLAHKLDPHNSQYYADYFRAILDKGKDAATSGDADYFNRSQKELADAYNRLANWAPRSKSSDAASVYRDYAKALTANQMVPIGYDTPSGPQVVGYAPGNALEKSFATASFQQEYQAFRQSMLGQGIGLGNVGGSPGYSGFPGYGASPVGGNGRF